MRKHLLAIAELGTPGSLEVWKKAFLPKANGSKPQRGWSLRDQTPPGERQGLSLPLRISSNSGRCTPFQARDRKYYPAFRDSPRHCVHFQQAYLHGLFQWTLLEGARTTRTILNERNLTQRIIRVQRWSHDFLQARKLWSAGQWVGCFF